MVFGILYVGDIMQDYSKYKINNEKFIGGSGANKEILINGFSYLVKFQKSSQRGWLFNHVSEYIGSKVCQLLGVPSQECFLGKYEDKNVVVIKNFLKKNENLLLFENVMEMMLDINRGAHSYSLDDIEHIIIGSGKTGSIRASIDRFFDMYVIDALNGNPGRSPYSWGYIESIDGYHLAPVFNNDECLYPEVNSDILINSMLNSDSKIEEMLFDGSRDILSHNQPMSFRKVLFSREYKECFNAIERIVSRINLDEINELIESVEGISDARKEFYRQIYKLRYERILLPAYEGGRR